MSASSGGIDRITDRILTGPGDYEQASIFGVHADDDMIGGAGITFPSTPRVAAAACRSLPRHPGPLAEMRQNLALQFSVLAEQE